MSEELYQRNLIANPPKIGKWDYYNIGSTSITSLKNNGIIRNIDYGIIERKKVDGIVVLKKKVIAIIEHKSPSSLKTERQIKIAIEQEIEVARALECNLLIVTDSKNSIWINALTGRVVLDENGTPLVYPFVVEDSKLPLIIEKASYSLNERNDQLLPRKLVNPTDLAKQIWQDVWSVSGATPENCLYTFVELFIFKYLSDLEVLKGNYHFETLLGLYSDNSEDEVLKHYASAIRPRIKELFPENLVDKTTIINGTIFVSKDQKAVSGYSAVFKKVLLKFRDYGKLEYIDFDFKSQLFESFLKESISKKNWGQFFTPLKVVRAILQMAKDDVREGTSICDPACGVGKFLLEAIASRVDEFFSVEGGVISSKIRLTGYDKGFDKDEQKTIILAKANMLIYLSDLIKDNPNLTNGFAKLFNETFTLKSNSILGTLSDPIENEFDLILTNPPYVTSGTSNLKEEVKKSTKLSGHYKVGGMGVEGMFMEWIVRAMKPNGKAFIVIPDGLLFRQNDRYLRKFIIDNCKIDAIISLPLNTFFTTNKKTYILCLSKKIKVAEAQVDPVMTYLVSEIGESRDVYRFEIDQNDLHEAASLFQFFKSNKDNFSKINSDPRCKIISASFFSENLEIGWEIDKLWSEEERIALGVIEKKNKVSILGYLSMLERLALSIQELQAEMGELESAASEIPIRICKVIELFEIERGLSKYTKRYGNENKGDFPVYSASNREPLTYINTYDYDGEFLTWATNGFAGYVMIISGKFSINGDRGLLIPKSKDISIEYVRFKLEPLLREIARGRKGEKGEDEFTKVYPSMLHDLEIPMPYDSLSGRFLFEEQYRIAEIYKKKEWIDKEIKLRTNEVTAIEVDILGA